MDEDRYRWLCRHAIPGGTCYHERHARLVSDTGRDDACGGAHSGTVSPDAFHIRLCGYVVGQPEYGLCRRDDGDHQLC